MGLAVICKFLRRIILLPIPCESSCIHHLFFLVFTDQEGVLFFFFFLGTSGKVKKLDSQEHGFCIIISQLLLEHLELAPKQQKDCPLPEASFALKSPLLLASLSTWDTDISISSQPVLNLKDNGDQEGVYVRKSFVKQVYM